ncbi:hypothetical protein CcaCcLH18_04497 [Colletotrichum camelliae]|nr:hypothetical protein CcaCcLH18_04497 [Colletotrichum camelliae]
MITKVRGLGAQAVFNTEELEPVYPVCREALALKTPLFTADLLRSPSLLPMGLLAEHPESLVGITRQDGNFAPERLAEIATKNGNDNGNM